jgi:threonine/homoserine/homoserine lactone efflux protein
MTLEFLVTTLIITASPGTGVVYTLANALSRGARASLIAAFGCTLGIIPHLLAAIGGLAAMLHASAVIFEIFRYAGVAYLFYMAWNSLRENGALKVEGELPPRSAIRIIVDAVLLNLLNPKLSIFFLAFLPQFVRSDDPRPLASMLVLSAVFMVMTFAVFAAYGLLAVSMRDRVISKPAVMQWLRRAFAGVFVLLGLRLVIAER